MIFVTDMNGLIMQRDEVTKDANGNPVPTASDPRELHYYFNGVQLGDVGNNGTSDVDYVTSIQRHTTAQGTGAFRGGSNTSIYHADFDQSYDPINGFSYQSTAGRYTVRDGDTLAGIATAVWGDAALWYKIAEANGLTGGETLAAGTTLVIPNKVANLHNNASTFKPYDPNEILGDLAPESIQNIRPTARNSNKCGVFGAILLTVVAAVVTVATAGAFAATFGPILGGMLTGATASIASQGVGLATGIQDKFSWKAVAMAGISGAVGGATGGLNISGLGKLTNVVSNVARGAVSNAAVQGISVATGLQDKFDWAGVAAAGVVGGAMGAVHRSLPPGTSTLAAGALSGAAGAIAGSAARSLIDGSSFGDNIMRTLPDVIGNTIGNLVGGLLNDPVQPMRAGAELENANGLVDETIFVTGRRMSWWEQKVYDFGGFLLEMGIGRALTDGSNRSAAPRSLYAGISGTAHLNSRSSGGSSTIADLVRPFNLLPRVQSSMRGRATAFSGVQARAGGADMIEASMMQRAGVESTLAAGLGTMVAGGHDMGTGAVMSIPNTAEQTARGGYSVLTDPIGSMNSMVAVATNPSLWFSDLRTSVATGDMYGIGLHGGGATLQIGSAVAGVPPRTLGLAGEISILRTAARQKGNFGIGSASAAEAARLGEAWVGDGHRVASNGALISSDGLRQFRPPSFKPALGIIQANFEWRLAPMGQWQGNGHLNIVD